MVVYQPRLFFFGGVSVSRRHHRTGAVTKGEHMRHLRDLPTKTISGLWHLLEGYRFVFLGSLVLLGVAVGAETGGFLVVKRFIDSVLVYGDWTRPLIYFAGGYLLFALARGIASFFSGRGSAFSSEMVIRHVRNGLFDHIQRLSFNYHDRTKTGELIQRSTSDVDTIRRFYSEQFTSITRILFLFSINFITILILQWKLALITVATVPITIATSLYFFRRIHRAYQKYQEQDGKLSTVVQENLSGMRVVRAFARQKHEEEKFAIENELKLELGKKTLIAETVYWPLSEFMGGVQIIIGLAAGGLLVMQGDVSIGTFVAYAGLVRGIIWPLQQLGRLIARISKTSVSYERIAVVINEEEEDLTEGFNDLNRRLEGEVCFDKVNFAYERDVPVLKDISFTAHPGQRIALLGEPGSGKSTLVNLIPRFYDHTSGVLTIDGRAISEYSRHFLRQNVGMVEQEPFLFSADIRTNITYGVEREVTPEDIERVAKAAAIHESVQGFPKQYDTIVGERGVTLSGGQKQRIAIARTLLKDPSLLILDDSTSSVDSTTEAEIRGALEELIEGRTTFIIAHRVQSLMKADLILVFKEGEIIQRGNHEELIAQSGFYHDVFTSQTGIGVKEEKEASHGR